MRRRPRAAGTTAAIIALKIELLELKSRGCHRPPVPACTFSLPASYDTPQQTGITQAVLSRSSQLKLSLSYHSRAPGSYIFTLNEPNWEDIVK